jgi:hypothetical protein
MQHVTKILSIALFSLALVACKDKGGDTDPRWRRQRVYRRRRRRICCG